MEFNDPGVLARACYKAYVDKDLAAMEQLLGDDFHFTSPLDNHIDRATYFSRCWPHSADISDIKLIHVASSGDLAFVTYEGTARAGKRFRNAEVLTTREGKIIDVEVYFGWDIPHAAPRGHFVTG